jgi:cobalt/nickel transport system permease protein
LEGALAITLPGLIVATRLVLRVVAGAGIGLLVVWTARWSDLLAGLSAMRMPDIVVATLAMTQQQIVVLMRTVENIHLARESRMLGTGSATENRRWVVDRASYVANRSFKTADEVYDAMLARGFGGEWRSIRRVHMASIDIWWLAGCVLACAMFLGFDRIVVR